MMKDILTEWRVFLNEQEQKPAPTIEDIKKAIMTALYGTGVQNITPAIAFAVANKESTFDPKAVNGSHVGLFGIGRPAAVDVGYEEEYDKDPFDIYTNSKIGVKYLQYQYDFATTLQDKYPTLDTLVLAYSAYNLGRKNMLRMVNVLSVKGAVSDKNLIAAIFKQDPKLIGKTDLDTVRNYYKSIEKTFSGI